MGVSAGSIIASKTIENPVQDLYGERNFNGVTRGLGWIDFQVIAHYGSSYFENLTLDKITAAAKQHGEQVFGLDDDSAVLVTDGKVSVVSEGEWEVVG